jgi:hypothetical protein
MANSADLIRPVDQVYYPSFCRFLYSCPCDLPAIYTRRFIFSYQSRNLHFHSSPAVLSHPYYPSTNASPTSLYFFSSPPPWTGLSTRGTFAPMAVYTASPFRGDFVLLPNESPFCAEHNGPLPRIDSAHAMFKGCHKFTLRIESVRARRLCSERECRQRNTGAWAERYERIGGDAHCGLSLVDSGLDSIVVAER